MHLCSAKRLLTALLLLAGSLLRAQTSTYSNPNALRENNPYSRFGIGELWNGNTTPLKSMGNITSAWRDPYFVNNDNPASYASLLSTTFSGGVAGSSRTISNAAGYSYTTGTASLGYLTLAIPFKAGKGRGGFAIGLRPFSRSYYSLADSIYSPASGLVKRIYAGEGGLNYAYAGGAYKRTRRYKVNDSSVGRQSLSLGVNFGYLFGTYNKAQNALGIDSLALNNLYESAVVTNNVIGGIYWKGGALVEQWFRDSSYSLAIGATVELGQNLNERVSLYRISAFNFGDTIVNDTVYRQNDYRGKLTMPGSFSFGVNFSKEDKWLVGVDFKSTAWSQFKSTGDSALNFGIASQTYRIALGGQITPNALERAYFSRVTYRMGFYYGTDYVRLSNTTMPVMGVTVGASFPYRKNVRTSSRLHTSFDIGRLGTTSSGLLRQNYIRFGLGLSFNDYSWFGKRKYD